MRKTRRIEITAFRRQIVIHSVDGPGTARARPSVSSDEGTLETTETDSDEGSASHHDATPAAELALLVETLYGQSALRLAERSDASGVSLTSPDLNRTGDETTCEKTVACNKQISGGQR